MDEDRRLRYQDKSLWIENRTQLIETWLDEYESEQIPDTKTILAVFKAFQEIVEATMDIIAMYLRDQGMAARDDYLKSEPDSRSTWLDR